MCFACVYGKRIRNTRCHINASQLFQIQYWWTNYALKTKPNFVNMPKYLYTILNHAYYELLYVDAFTLRHSRESFSELFLTDQSPIRSL